MQEKKNLKKIYLSYQKQMMKNDEILNLIENNLKDNEKDYYFALSEALL